MEITRNDSVLQNCIVKLQKTKMSLLISLLQMAVGVVFRGSESLQRK